LVSRFAVYKVEAFPFADLSTLKPVMFSALCMFVISFLLYTDSPVYEASGALYVSQSWFFVEKGKGHWFRNTLWCEIIALILFFSWRRVVYDCYRDFQRS